jgi:hypothetical protein
MIQIWIFIAFIACLVIGSLVANALGRLPNSEELEAEDQARYRKMQRSE